MVLAGIVTCSSVTPVMMTSLVVMKMPVGAAVSWARGIMAGRAVVEGMVAARVVVVRRENKTDLVVRYMVTDDGDEKMS